MGPNLKCLCQATSGSGRMHGDAHLAYTRNQVCNRPVYVYVRSAVLYYNGDLVLEQLLASHGGESERSDAFLLSDTSRMTAGASHAGLTRDGQNGGNGG